MANRVFFFNFYHTLWSSNLTSFHFMYIHLLQLYICTLERYLNLTRESCGPYGSCVVSLLFFIEQTVIMSSLPFTICSLLKQHGLNKTPEVWAVSLPLTFEKPIFLLWFPVLLFWKDIDSVGWSLKLLSSSKFEYVL